MTQQTTPKNPWDLKVIALTVICIVLAASLVGIIAFSPSAGNADLQAQLTEKDNTIASLNAQLAQALLDAQNSGLDPNTAASYEAEIMQLNQQIAYLNSTLTDTSDLQALLALQVRGDLYGNAFTQGAGEITTLYNGGIGYGGYLIISEEATSNTTYVYVQCEFGQYIWAHNQTIGNAGTIVCPVLPGTLTVKIGNLDTANMNTVNATITYYY